MFVNEDMNYMEDEEDIGTSPINLPDPSMFSDFHENETHSSELNADRLHSPHEDLNDDQAE